VEHSYDIVMEDSPMRRVERVKITAVVVLALFAACCLVTDHAQAQEEEAIVIGAVVSLTGRDSAFGGPCLNGIRVAIGEANAEGGIQGHPVTLQVYDDRSDPILAAEGVRVLTREHQPIAIVGSNTSMVTKAAAVAAQGVGVPLVMPEATNPGITSIGNRVFRVCFVDPDMASALANFAYNHLRVRKVAILMEEKHDYTVSLARSFGKQFKALNGEVVLTMGYQPGETKFTDALRQIKDRKADAILVSGFYPEAAAILGAAKDLKMDIAFLGGDAWEADGFFAMAGDALTEDSRVYVASHFSPDIKRIKIRGFVDAFEELYNRRPNTSAALGYDACAVVLNAIANAKSLTPDGVTEALTDVHHEGVTGHIDIDSTRSTSKRVIIMKATPDHHFTFVESVSGAESEPQMTNETNSP
jgi:branched-chain amino acid transport system substrate-binding protein